MRRLTLYLLVATSIAACTADAPGSSRRRSRAPNAAEVDSGIPGEVRQSFVAPESWDTVTNASGLTFRQPREFTTGLGSARLGGCGAATPGAEVPVLDKGFLERWPLTLGMRRGDVNQIASANGFTIDSTDVATHDGEGTRLRTGEGWTLLSGRSNGVTVLFAAVRHPAGCHLIWAARGAELNTDTLGMVLATVRFTY
jgi:hypothetical protein